MDDLACIGHVSPFFPESASQECCEAATVHPIADFLLDIYAEILAQKQESMSFSWRCGYIVFER